MADLISSSISQKRDALRAYSLSLQSVAKAPTYEESGHIWRYLDASTNLTNLRGTLDDGDLVACCSKAMGCGESTESTTDDDDIEAQLSFRSGVENEVLCAFVSVYVDNLKKNRVPFLCRTQKELSRCAD